MGENKNKLFPKLKKKLKGFITDESGKISKKDALGLAVGAMLFSGVDEVFASPHINTCTPVQLANPVYPNTPNDITNDWVWTKEANATCSNVWTISSTHNSWIVNWHYSWTSPMAGQAWIWHSSHGSHGSHGSHWSY